ncbi:MAG: hypothetical protein LBM25_06830 [Bacteroidales bacterium]|jgi:hypothetical protein|nr:hypothetical protein [Bacteroidales bacterium]
MNKDKTYIFTTNWFKKNKINYILLIIDILFVLACAFFSIKDYLEGLFGRSFHESGILILLLVMISNVVRFNISLLCFNKEKAGFYLTLIFVIFATVIDSFSVDYDSIYYYGFSEAVGMFNSYIIEFPQWLNTILIYSLYVWYLYAQLIIYTIYILTNTKLKKDSSNFQVFSGFYAAQLSSKLKVIDVVILSLFVLASMVLGILSDNINWTFLSVGITLYSLNVFFRRFSFKNLSKKNMKIIYVISTLISAIVIYTQRIPYVGLIAFISSLVIMLLVFIITTKNYIKSFAIVILSFFVIPILSMGYNPFTLYEYGVVNRYVSPKQYSGRLIITDEKGLLGARDRDNNFFIPKYIKAKKQIDNNVFFYKNDTSYDIYDLKTRKFK